MRWRRWWPTWMPTRSRRARPAVALRRRQPPVLAPALPDLRHGAFREHAPGLALAARNPWARRYHMADTPDDDSASRWIGSSAQRSWRDGPCSIRSAASMKGISCIPRSWTGVAAAKNAGWQIVYLPAAQIIHHEGKSSEQVVAARHIRFQSSKVRYFRKFHGPIQAETLRVFILASFAVEWALEAGKWLAGSKRSLRRERIAAYGQLLRTRLGSGVRD